MSMRMLQNKKFILILGILFGCIPFYMAQSIITGAIRDKDTQEGLFGVQVSIDNQLTSTTSNIEGEFTLITEQEPPFTLDFFLLGYEPYSIKIITKDQTVSLNMSPQTVVGKEVVVTVSRIEESILQAPVTIEKLDAIEIRTSASLEAYSALANLKGVQLNTSSLTFTSINTRGFSDIQNWRFVQLIDGMDMNAPGLNYPVGAMSSPSDLDIANMELIPGAGSALYGPNAFNGMLHIHTKSPFYYQGLSAEVKSGATMQQGVSVHPFGEFSLRFAHNFNNKFAFKVATSAYLVHDWEANDTSFRITNEMAAAGQSDAYLHTPRNAPYYDAVNAYGDESQNGVAVDTGGGYMLAHRTGIPEKNIINYNQQIYKVNAALHYRIKENLELSYDFRFVHGDAILRHTTIYPMVNLWQQVHKLELKGRNFFARTYYSFENAGDSYFMFGTGGYITNGLKSNDAWGTDFGNAYRGTITGVAGHDFAAARAYADRDLPSFTSDTFQQLRQQTLTNTNAAMGGSRLVDRTSFIHSDAMYDFSKIWNVIPIQAGASFRRYNLVSDGHLFNDGDLGFNKPIGVMEYGAYVQASKSLFNERLTLRASGRYDKNQNFKGRITPRASAVVSLGKNKEHNFRFSFQTGFRNPATQETYIALDLGQGILLGGVQNNFDHYNYQLTAANPLTHDTAGTIISGSTIHNNLVSIPSFYKYILTRDTHDLVFLNPSYLRQEHLTSYEFGFKTLIGNKLYIDANYYYNIYKDFVTRISAFNVQTFRAFGVYTNISDNIVAQGASVGVDYELPKRFRIGVNYSFSIFNADSAIAHNPGFLPSFNTPRNRVNVSLSNRDIWKGLGFNLKFRWSEGYLWQSPFGQGAIKAYQVLDLAVSYRLPNLPLSLKVGGNNILNQPYQQVYGGPKVGTQLYLSLQFDPLAYPSKKGERHIKEPKTDNTSTEEKPKTKPKKGEKIMHGYERF